MTLIILLALLIFFALIGMPLAYALGLSSVVTMLFTAPQFLVMLPQQIWGGAHSYVLVAMPLFILMGELMNESGITDRLIKLCMSLIRPFHGGLGEVNIVASMLFGGISGSSVADTSALGSVLIPAMEKRGYPPEFSAGITVASSTMGMIIPPSIPMIMYSMISGDSIANLFIAGLLPGLSIGILQLVVCFVISRRNGYHPAKEAFDARVFFSAVLYGLPAAIMPVLIVLSVSFGIATASESAGVAVLYCLILGVVVYRKLKWKAIAAALRRTFLMSSAIVIIISFSMIFTWLMTMQRVPEMFASFFMMLNLPIPIIIGIFVVIILFIGTFIDVSPAILMLTPIILPVMRNAGMSSLQFGAMFIVGLAIGLVTPPVGMCLNTCSKINGMPILKIARGALPFTCCNIVVLILTAFVPAFSTWLPSVLSR